MPAGSMPSASHTSLGSRLATRSTRRVARSVRDPVPAGSSTRTRYWSEAGVLRVLVWLVTITCGLRVPSRSRWSRHRCSACQVAGSRGTGCGRCSRRTVCALASTSATVRWRSSRDGVACSSASRRASAPGGWARGSVVQRRNSRRGGAGERGAQRRGGLLDPGLAARGCPAGGVVDGEGEAGLGEELLQGAGESSGRLTRAAGALQDRLRAGRAGLGEQAAQPADHERGPPHAVAGGGGGGETGEPGGGGGPAGGSAPGPARRPARGLLAAMGGQTRRARYPPASP